MLRYLNQGFRPFGDYPMPVHRRPNWEFYAVTGGRLAPLYDPPMPTEWLSDTLWIFPPGHSHGWIGEPAQTCRITVFHFSDVPAELDRRVRAAGRLVVPLSRAAKQQLHQIAARVQPHYWRPNELSPLHFERALMELSLLSLENSTPPESRLPKTAAIAPGKPPGLDAITPLNPALARVLVAENWYRRHLATQPTLTRVAQACGLSSSHLRRLFQAVRQLSPREVFDRIRMEQAMQLLAHSDRKLADVAAECGFAGASQFCQFFKTHNGTTPAAWRKHAYSPYQDPASPAQRREATS